MTAVLEPPATKPTLEQSQETALNEHLLVMEAGASMVEHAIRSGEALLAVRQQIPHGAWQEWLAGQIGFTAGYTYMRLAQYRDLVIAERPQYIHEALQITRGRPGLAHTNTFPDDVKAQAREMHEAGMTCAAIAKVVGAHKVSVQEWCNPEYAARNKARKLAQGKRKTAERRALREQQRQQARTQALVKAGEAFNEIYARLTRMDQLLGQARSECVDGEKRRAIIAMHEHRNKMMDLADKFLGVS